MQIKLTELNAVNSKIADILSDAAEHANFEQTVGVGKETVEVGKETFAFHKLLLENKTLKEDKIDKQKVSKVVSYYNRLTAAQLSDYQLINFRYVYEEKRSIQDELVLAFVDDAVKLMVKKFKEQKAVDDLNNLKDLRHIEKQVQSYEIAIGTLACFIAVLLITILCLLGK